MRGLAMFSRSSIKKMVLSSDWLHCSCTFPSNTERKSLQSICQTSFSAGTEKNGVHLSFKCLTFKGRPDFNVGLLSDTYICFFVIGSHTFPNISTNIFAYLCPFCRALEPAGPAGNKRKGELFNYQLKKLCLCKNIWNVIQHYVKWAAADSSAWLPTISQNLHLKFVGLVLIIMCRWLAWAGWLWSWPSSCLLETVRPLWTRTGSQVS